MLTNITVLGAIALLGMGCETPGENALLAGGAAGTVTGVALGASGVDPAITIPVTLGAAALAAGGSYLISKTEVSNRESQIALARGANYYAQLTNKQRASLQKSNIRFLAVDSPTQRNRGYGVVPVMIYDIYAGQLASRKVFNLASPPPLGQVLNVHGYVSQYVGLGSY